MSHIVKIETQVRDLQALTLACQRLQLAPPQSGTVKLFTTQTTGHAVQLAGWNYPAVFDLAAGSAAYDNYGGRWGEETQLHRLIQAYAIENSTRPQCTSCNGFL